ncbi:hypothetical protein MMC25_005771 [Agyrium rufum]|nr:hypothetical protein [Agyrium rufum]
MPYAFCHVSGRLATTFHDLHEKYGPVVRTAPNEVSFIGLDAMKIIYGERRKACPPFQKNYDSFNETRNQIAHSVFLANDLDHGRMRKIINPAFSDQALRQQEPRMQELVQKLMKGLDEKSREGTVIDLNMWYNYTAFDVVAELTLGESFDTLRNSQYQPWINLISKTWKAITIASAIKSIVPSIHLLRAMLPTSVILQKEVDKFNLILDRVKEKIALGATDQIDLLSLVVRNNMSKEKMTDQEIISNATLFVAAGTETVTTLLSSLTYLLTRHPDILAKLTKEIRDEFVDESSISISRVGQNEYLSACIQEAFRIFPPIPEGLPRIVPPKGEYISGYWIPGGTFVQVSTFAATHSPGNFTDPQSFLPDRWLRKDPSSSVDKLEVSQPFSFGPRNCVGQK